MPRSILMVALSCASQVEGVELLGPLEGPGEELQNPAGALVAVYPEVQQIERRAAQVPARYQRDVEAGARHHDVRSGSVYPVELRAPLWGFDYVNVLPEGRELRRQGVPVHPRRTHFQDDRPCVGEEAGQRYLQASVSGKEDALAPDAVSQRLQPLPDFAGT